MRNYEVEDIMGYIRPTLRTLYGNHKFRLVGFSMLDKGKSFPNNTEVLSGWFYVKDLREEKTYSVNLENNEVTTIEEKKR